MKNFKISFLLRLMVMILLICLSFDSKAQHEIGQQAHGGVIFYILQPGDMGYEEGFQKGLVAAKEDYLTADNIKPEGIPSTIMWAHGNEWGCFKTDLEDMPNVLGPRGTVPLGANADLGYGQINTTTISKNSCIGENNAAKFSTKYAGQGFNDWYLPSIAELVLIKVNLSDKGLIEMATLNGIYWSSTEFNDLAAWILNFGGNPYKISFSNKNASYLVRPVRTFKVPKPKPYIIEMIGYRGELEFPVEINAQPTTGKITLNGLSEDHSKQYVLSNGTWTGGNVFTADIRLQNSPSKSHDIFPNLKTSVNKIKLKFTTGTYKIVGVLTGDLSAWHVNGNNSLVIGLEHGNEIVKTVPKEKIFTLVINDKHYEGSDSGFGWYLAPTKAITPTFRMVHLLLDDERNEIALYAFENDDSRTEEKALKNQIKGYKILEIENHIRSLYASINDNDFKSMLRSDLITQLIVEAMRQFPSEIIGMKSTGHGAPYFLMNKLLMDPFSIEKSLSWIKEIRGGKSIEFLDFATNCNVASLSNLMAIGTNVDYVIASDLTATAPPADPPKYTMMFSLPSSLGNYSTYFSDSSKPLLDIFKSMLVKVDEVFNNPEITYTALSTLTLNDYKNQVTIFDMSSFHPILLNIGWTPTADNSVFYYQLVSKLSLSSGKYYTEGEYNQSDFKTAIEFLYPQYTNFSDHWNKFVKYQFNNKKRLDWDTTEPQGLIFDRK